MKANKIKVRHIYYVNFEPTRKGEFPSKHLTIVLRKNHDKITFVVLPLTGSSAGDGINKVKLGKIPSLPTHLQKKISYAVLDQIRTISYTRFEDLTEDGKIVESVLEKEDFDKIMAAIFTIFLKGLDKEEKKDILKMVD